MDSRESHEQIKVRQVVEWYKKGFPAEYKAFVAQTAQNRAAVLDEFGRMAGGDFREMHDIPERMFAKLVQRLTPEEMAWFTTKKATRWFAETFPEFCLTKEI